MYYIAQWKGASWASVGPSTALNSSVRSLAIDAAGNVYASGSFTSAGGVSVPGIARWDKQSWQAVGGASASGSSVARTASDEALFSIRSSSGSDFVYSGLAGQNSPLFPEVAAESSALSADPMTGDAHLVIRLSGGLVIYRHWDSSAETWGTPVTLANDALDGHVSSVFSSSGGYGAALWRGSDRIVYKRDFNAAGTVAAEADFVGGTWRGMFSAAETGDNGFFSIFGLDPFWVLSRQIFSVSAP